MRPFRALAYARRHQDRFLTELKEFIGFASVSSQPKHAEGVKSCASWLARHLRQIGFERAELIQTRRHPVVYAERLRAAALPTVLIYGHYDVVPPEPLSEWQSPPFVPTVRGDNLYGRGACDDKGQLFAHVKALESYLQTGGEIPVNVKCVFEGEEEIGSPNFTRFVVENKRALRASVAVISDTKMLGPGRPAISYAQRGALSMEMEVHGPRKDLHSGNFGGAIHNPIQAICEMIARLHHADGRVAIPGFYDDVRQWSEKERAYMARTGPRDAEILAKAEVESGWGERGYSLYERTTIRPALTVNGISGGYQGSGGKGIIPARAAAKISFRLVPDQDPEDIERAVRRHIASITPPGITSRVRASAKSKPALIDRTEPFLRAAAVACRSGFGSPPVFVRSGGTIPVVSTLQELLGISTVLMGFALPDDSIHAPNEKFHLPNFYGGIRASISFLAAAARIQDGTRARRAQRLERVRLSGM